MILDTAAGMPTSLAPYCRAMTLGVGTGRARACRLCEADVFDRALSAFSAAYHQPDRDALVSLWSMYYLAALIVPPTSALLRHDVILPVGFDEIGMTIGGDGRPDFRLSGEGCRAGKDHSRRFETLVDGHLAPFVTLCATRTQLSPRVFWSNAAVLLEWTLGELATVPTIPGPRIEAEALLAGHAGACRLAHPMRVLADGTRRRRVCCLRYRLAGVDDCGTLCPRGFVA